VFVISTEIDEIGITLCYYDPGCTVIIKLNLKPRHWRSFFTEFSSECNQSTDKPFYNDINIKQIVFVAHL